MPQRYTTQDRQPLHIILKHYQAKVSTNGLKNSASLLSPRL
jgi:hypothetical protein